MRACHAQRTALYACLTACVAIAQKRNLLAKAFVLTGTDSACLGAKETALGATQASARLQALKTLKTNEFIHRSPGWHSSGDATQIFRSMAKEQDHCILSA